jgi:hypothetical protein
MIAEMATSTVLMLSPYSSRATSPTATFIAQESDRNRKRLQTSVSLGLGLTGVFEELFDVYEDCHQPNWDGYEATAITRETYLNAFRFLESLPLGTPAPSVGAEPDGHLTLEWHRSPRRTLSVSVSPDGDMHYAALLGSSKAYGTEPFFGDAPKAVLDLIHRVYAG